MYRIGGRLRDQDASFGGVDGGIPLLHYWISNQCPLTGHGTMSDGQFDWGGRLLKSNGGARRSSQNDWKPFKECKGKRRLDCESDGSSRYESRT